MTAWPFDQLPVDPVQIVRFLHNSGATVLTFKRPSLPRALQQAFQGDNDVSSFGKFDKCYRKSVEIAWISARTLLRKSESDPDELFKIKRYTDGAVKFELRPQATKEIRQAYQNPNDPEKARQLLRLMVVPDVLAGLIHLFNKEVTTDFEIGLSVKDNKELADANRTFIAITSSDFTQSGIASRTHNDAGEEAYFELEANESQEGFSSFGWHSSKDKSDPAAGTERYEYGNVVQKPVALLDENMLRIPSFLCFGDFSARGNSGLLFAFKKSEKLHGAPEASQVPAVEGYELPDTLWWYNHHERRKCRLPSCPAHIRDEPGANIAFIDYSIAPYLKFKSDELRAREFFDHMVVMATGVRFDVGDAADLHSDLLGLFLSVCIRNPKNPAHDYEERLHGFMTMLRANMGHTRFLMIENLAAEIASQHKELSNLRKKQGDMLQLLDQPLEELRSRVLGAIDEARRITQIVRGPPFALFVKAVELAPFFEQGRRMTLGSGIVQIAHKPDDYEDADRFEDLISVLSAMIIKIFGKEWGATDGPRELLTRARHLVVQDIGEDAALARLCADLTGLNDLDLFSRSSRYLLDKTTRYRPGQKKEEDELTEEFEELTQKLVRAIERLKDVLHYPAKESDGDYPWLPLFLVLFAIVEEGAGDTVTVKVHYMGRRPYTFEKFSEVFKWLEDAQGKFLDPIPLPVPRYNMFLTFLSNLIVFAQNEQKSNKKRLQATIDIMQTEARWTMKINFGFTLFRHADDKGRLKQRMNDALENRSVPIHTGNLSGPFQTWAAQCSASANRRGGPYTEDLFALPYEGHVCSVNFNDKGNELTMHFGAPAER